MIRLRGTLLPLAVVISMIGGTAAAQAVRGEELIVQALRVTPDIDAGETLYPQHCVTCHGKKAYGTAKEVIPSLASQLPI